jgi:hypothetical protein
MGTQGLDRKRTPRVYVHGGMEMTARAQRQHREKENDEQARLGGVQG